MRKGGDCTMRSFMNCTPHQILLGWSNQQGWGWRGRWYIRDRG
jgi:hypothetical protein